MIGFLRGILIRKAPPRLLLDVQGVGYELEAPMTTFYELPAPGAEIKLHTHLVIREDAHSLYGFAGETEQLLFKALIKINGVGPKLALTILSGLSAAEFYRCVENNDTKSLIRLPGVGQKTAERLLMELRGRLPDTGLPTSIDDPVNPKLMGESIQNPAGNPKQEAVTALCALGYKPQDAQRMVQSISLEDKTLEDIIRLALRGTLK